MRRSPLAFLLLLVPLLAGCLAGDDTDGDGRSSPAERARDVPELQWDVTAGVDWWEDFATSYPKHDANTPTNQMAREHLIAEMEALGFDVEVRSYEASAQGVDLPDVGEPLLQYHAVVATIPGTEMPDRRIGLVSHYDTQAATIMGAYDDASGVAAQYNICKALAEVPMRRTLACIFFDAEERGLVASEKYVEDVIEEGDEGFVYDLVVGYDMTGINWPGHDWKMYVMTGDEIHALALAPWADELMHDVLEYPRTGVEVLDVHDRNSDEMNFKRAGVPILRFAGGRDASDYPAYHMPHDLVEYVYQFTGGRENFEAGFATVVESSYRTALAFDATDMDELRRVYG